MRDRVSHHETRCTRVRSHAQAQMLTRKTTQWEDEQALFSTQHPNLEPTGARTFPHLAKSRAERQPALEPAGARSFPA